MGLGKAQGLLGGEIIRSPVSWVGNKTALLPYINAILPERTERFVDVFGGSGSVLLSRKPCPFEVYNDFDGNLVNLFRCMRDKTVAFLGELGFLPLNSRAEFEMLKKFLAKEQDVTRADLEADEQLARVAFSPPDAEELTSLIRSRADAEDVRRAVAFLKLIRYSYSSGLKSYACQPFDVRRLFGLIRDLHERMANTVIENRDFEALIRHYDRPNTVFYCDPPYTQELRVEKQLDEATGKYKVRYSYDGKRWQDVDMPDYGETATVEKIISNNAESGRIDAMLISDGDKKVILTSTDGGIHWAEQIAFTASSITHFYYGTSASLPSTSGSFQGERFVCRYKSGNFYIAAFR